MQTFNSSGSLPPIRPAGLWHRAVARLGAWLWFSQVRIRHAERLPAGGPILYLGHHRNGAVDGLVYHRFLPRAVFLISVQLVRNLWGRLFFTGLAVARPKDREDASGNAAALTQARDLLRAGGELFLFPEGTSSLGPRPLPFKSGAFRLALEHFERATEPLQIVPLGIHYECGWAFRSGVEVVVGRPLQLLRPGTTAPYAPGDAVRCELSAGASSRQRLRALKRQVRAAMAEVGTSFADARVQARAEGLATIATVGARRSWSAALKHLEAELSPALEAGWREWETACGVRSGIDARLLTFHGVPVFPLRAPLLEAAVLLIAAPLLAAAALLNLPALLPAWWAGRRWPDDRNVIALWRLLVGAPCWVGWAFVGSVVSLWTGHALALAAAWGITLAALVSYRGVKRRFVAGFNHLCCPAGRSGFLELRRLLQDELDISDSSCR